MATKVKQSQARRADINDVDGLRVGMYCRVSKADADKPKAQRERSVDDQERDGRRWLDASGAVLAGVYRDVGESASEYRNKPYDRPEFVRLLGDLDAGKLDLIWFWDQDRFSREPIVILTLMGKCADLGVNWVIGSAVQDLTDDDVQFFILIRAGMAKAETRKLRKRVNRGMETAMLAGRPGTVPFGYSRRYDPQTGVSIEDLPNEWDGNGRPLEDSPAYVVRELFDRVLAGESMRAILRDLHERGIKTIRDNEFTRAGLARILRNDSYIGVPQRGEVAPGVVPFPRPPLVDAETFHKVQQLLDDPKRSTWREARTDLLLSTVIYCVVCGGKMRGRVDRWRRHGTEYYSCDGRPGYRQNGCVSINADKIDPWVEDLIVRWLSDPEVGACLAAGDDSAAAKAARGDAEAARHELMVLRKAAEDDPDFDSIIAAGRAKHLKARIAAAEELVNRTSQPAILHGVLGDHARETWDALPVDIKRKLVRTIIRIEVLPVPSGTWRRYAPVAARVRCTWLVGEQPGEPVDFQHWLPEKAPEELTRQWSPGQCKRGHDLTDEANIYRDPTYGKRQCRKCQVIRAREARARQGAKPRTARRTSG